MTRALDHRLLAMHKLSIYLVGTCSPTYLWDLVLRGWETKVELDINNSVKY
jgi:hypothetical protein